MQTEELIRELPKGLIKWYQFHKGSKALYISVDETKDEPLAEVLIENELETEIISINQLESLVKENRYILQDVYEYIVISGALERSKEPESILQILKNSLSATGKLLIGMDNRLGIRYFCGDRDIYTGRNFDSIENYVRFNTNDKRRIEGRTYAKAEIEQMLKEAGFSNYRFYSVLPELSKPQVLFAEDYLPEEELEVRIFPQYNYPETVFLEEERLYTTLIQNGLFHAMANGYLIECPMDGVYANVKQITASMERGREHAMFTIIRKDNKVEKRSAYSEGKEKINQLLGNNQYLKEQGVTMVDAFLEEGVYVMPYIQGEAATDYFRKILSKNKEMFLKELDCFWEIIKNSSEAVSYEDINWEEFEPNWQKRKKDDPGKDKWKKIAVGTKQEQENLGIILKRGYIDLVSLNCFHINGEFVFYDQELYIENLPAKVILHRTIQLIYRGNMQLEQILPLRELKERYHLNEYEELWKAFTSKFLNDLRNDKKLLSYYKTFRRDVNVINSNRQRMNYSVNEYQRLFQDIFHNTEGKKIYLFGAGNFTKKFLSQFGKDYQITGILDNNQSKWEMEMEGIPITGVDILLNMEQQEYKVIICIKNFVPIIMQLQQMGVNNYSIYDWNLEYPRKRLTVTSDKSKDEQPAPKKYHVGYIAGVFDLFHVGHLNMFKRAKELCDYLIVGVVSDESVMNSKKTTPYVPFEERIEMVRSCRYVDEAVVIPVSYGDTEEAYRRYRFDVQFSGSDYADDPIWLAKKVFLQKQGSDLVFFPYTQSTSSTKLKGLIEKGLI